MDVAKFVRVLGPVTATGKYLFIALAIAVGIVTIVLAADTRWHFLPVNPMSGPSAAARAGKRFWTTVGSDENLIVPAPLSPTVLASQYSMAVQLVIGDSRTPTPGRFRHVLHRGSNTACELTIPTTAGPTGHAGIQLDDLPPSADIAYKELGLPDRMNPGLMLDKFKNDLHIFVHTRGQDISGTDVMWLESMTIEDLPLNTPLTVGIVCNGRSVDVYLNCRLYSSMLLRGMPYMVPGENQWFGRYCAFPMTGLVQNLQLWADPLGPSDFAAMCTVAGSVGGPKAPAACSAKK